MVDRLIKYYRNINKNEIKFHLIEYARPIAELEKEIGLFSQTLKNKILKYF